MEGSALSLDIYLLLIRRQFLIGPEALFLVNSCRRLRAAFNDSERRFLRVYGYFNASIPQVPDCKAVIKEAAAHWKRLPSSTPAQAHARVEAIDSYNGQFQETSPGVNVYKMEVELMIVRILAELKRQSYFHSISVSWSSSGDYAYIPTFSNETYLATSLPKKLFLLALDDVQVLLTDRGYKCVKSDLSDGLRIFVPNK